MKKLHDSLGASTRGWVRSTLLENLAREKIENHKLCFFIFHFPFRIRYYTKVQAITKESSVQKKSVLAVEGKIIRQNGKNISHLML